MPNFVSIGLFYRHLAAKTANFAVLDFDVLWCCNSGNLRKLNADTQLHKPSLSNGIKIVSILQQLHVENEILRTNSVVQKRD